jgi:FtsP/CotA-like multicopper oxidase with cupredoxin domain
MKPQVLHTIPLFTVFLLAAGTTTPPAWSAAFVQCPDDHDGDGIPPTHPTGTVPSPVVLDQDDVDNVSEGGDDPHVSCMHLTGGDGWVTMGDGTELYIFSFSDVSAIPQTEVLEKGIFRANSPAPTIRTREGDKLYLTLTNVGTFNRPDLFDPHTVHYHGFPNASAIFDGLPESAIAINQQASLTYYYNNIEPGTYMFHCHVEATEHMQMGMLGNLYVDPIQNQTGIGGTVETPDVATQAGKEGGDGPYGYVYNDGDGSTAFDVEYVLQLQAFDHVFHNASRDTQPLPFADMIDTYPTLNGRGYPDTVVAGDLLPAAPNSCGGDTDFCEQPSSQPVSSLITAEAGDRILLRMSNLGVVQHYTVSVLGIPMKVVGRDARLLRGPDGDDVVYETNVVNLGGGESADVILDTSGVDAGTYFLYATNLNYLSNNEEDYGGYMTEIHLNN